MEFFIMESRLALNGYVSDWIFAYDYNLLMRETKDKAVEE